MGPKKLHQKHDHPQPYFLFKALFYDRAAPYGLPLRRFIGMISHELPRVRVSPPAKTGWAVLLSQQKPGCDHLHGPVPTLGLWISGDMACAVESRLAALRRPAGAWDQVFGEIYEGARLAASAMGARTTYMGDAVSPGSPGALDLRFCEIESIDPIDDPQPQLILRSAALHLGSWAGVEAFKENDFGLINLLPSTISPNPTATFLAWHEGSAHIELLRNIAFSAWEASQLHGASVAATVKPRRAL